MRFFASASAPSAAVFSWRRISCRRSASASRCEARPSGPPASGRSAAAAGGANADAPALLAAAGGCPVALPAHAFQQRLRCGAHGALLLERCQGRRRRRRRCLRCRLRAALRRLCGRPRGGERRLELLGPLLGSEERLRWRRGGRRCVPELLLQAAHLVSQRRVLSLEPCRVRLGDLLALLPRRGGRERGFQLRGALEALLREGFRGGEVGGQLAGALALRCESLLQLRAAPLAGSGLRADRLQGALGVSEARLQKRVCLLQVGGPAGVVRGAAADLLHHGLADAVELRALLALRLEPCRQLLFLFGHRPQLLCEEPRVLLGAGLQVGLEEGQHGRVALDTLDRLQLEVHQGVLAAQQLHLSGQVVRPRLRLAHLFEVALVDRLERPGVLGEALALHLHRFLEGRPSGALARCAGRRAAAIRRHGTGLGRVARADGAASPLGLQPPQHLVLGAEARDSPGAARVLGGDLADDLPQALAGLRRHGVEVRDVPFHRVHRELELRLLAALLLPAAAGAVRPLHDEVDPGLDLRELLLRCAPAPRATRAGAAARGGAVPPGLLEGAGVHAVLAGRCLEASVALLPGL